MSRSNDAGHFFQTTYALETTTRKTAKSKNTHGSPIKLPSKLLAIHPDPQHEGAVYIAEAAGEIKRVVLETGEIQRIATTAAAPLTSIAIESTSATLYAGCWDKNIYASALAPTATTGTPPRPPLSGHSDFVKCLLTTSLGGTPLLISGGADATIIVWNLHTGKALHKLTGHTKALQHLAIDPLSLSSSDETLTLFTASSDPEIRRWHISLTAAYELPDSLDAPIRAHETSVYALRFDGEGDLWTASADKTAKHLVRDRGWEADTSLPHPDFVRDVLVADPVVGLVVTACRDEEVRVWDVASGGLVCCYSGHYEEVTGLAMLGRLGMVSVSIDGTVRKWSLERKEMVRFLEELKEEEEGGGVKEIEVEKGGGVLTAEEEAELAELMDDE